MIIPYKTTLLVYNYGGTAFCSTGTVQNLGTIIVSVPALSTGFANYGGGVVDNLGMISIISNINNAPVIGSGFWNDGGTVNNYGVISIANNGNSGTAFINAGMVSNYGGMTVNSNVVGYIGFDNFGTTDNYGTVSSCGSVGSGLVIESGSTYSGTPVISC